MLVKIKAFLFTALTAAIFVFAGCSSDSGGNDGGKPAPSPEVQFAEDYASAVTSFIPGQKFQVQALVLNAEGQTVSFSCSNSKVLKVEDNGSGYAYIYPLSEGSAKVTAKAVVNEEVYFAVQEFTVAFDTEKYVANEESALSSVSVSSSDHASTFAIESSFTDFTVHLFKEDSLEAVKLSSEKSIEVETAPSTTYTAKVYCSNAESYTYFEVPSWTTPADSTPPEAITGLTASQEYDSKVTLNWTNSVSADVEKIVISYVEVKESDSEGETPEPTVTTLTSDDIDLTAGAQVSYDVSMTIKNTETTYNFTVKALDSAKNESDAAEATGKTIADITPCGEVSDLALVIESVSGNNASYSITYTNPSDSDFEKIVIQYAGDEETELTVTEGKFTATKGRNIVVRTVDNSGNKSSGIEVEYLESPSSFNISTDYSYSYTVKGFTDWAEDCTYVLKAVKTGGDGTAIESEEFTNTASAVILKNLEYLSTYSVSVVAKKITDTYTIQAASQAEQGPKVAKVVWEIHNSWNGNGFITPYILSDDTVKGYNIVLAGNESTQYTDISDFKYNAFIVHPAFNGNAEQFTLEATNLGTLEESGLFVRPAGTSFTTADYNNTGNQSSWGFSASVSLFAVEYDEANKDMYSFRKWAMSSVSAEVPSYALDNSWYGFACQGYADYNVWSSCANICMSNSWETITKNDYYDGRYFIVQHKYNGEEAAAPAVTTSVTADTLQVNYKLSSPDVQKVVVSVDGTDYDNVEIPSVEFLSPRGTVYGTASFENLKPATSYNVTVTQYTSETDTLKTTVSASTTVPVAKNVTAQARWTQEVLVKWEDITIGEKDNNGDAVTYTYKVTAAADGVETESKNVASGVGVAQFTGLTVGTEYTFTVYAIPANNDTVLYSNDSCVKTATPRKVTVVYKNNAESSNPYLTASSGKVPITNSEDSKGFTTSWIVWPALDGSIEFTYTADYSTDSKAVKPQTGTVDTFSLEATPKSGYESGLYLNFPSLGTSNTSATSLTDVIKAPDEEMDYSKATFFNGTTKCGSSYPYVIRPVFNDGKIQIGASSKVIQYRNSEGSPGVAMWAWSATYSYSTDAE